MPSIAITIDSRCNARCAHCCFSCSPRSEDRLSDDRIRALVAEALDSKDVDEVGLSGGEALLRPDLVFEIIRAVSGAGKRSTLVTNGFWGQTPASARSQLERLRSAGLSSMTVSYDDFHAAFVPVRRIRNILDANKHVELPCMLNLAVTRTHTADALLAELGESVLRTRVTKFPVLPVGAAQSLHPDEIIRDYEVGDELRCPGFEPVFHFDGQVYPCCSPAVFGSALRLGDVDEVDIAEAQRKIRHNRLLAVIRRFGFEPLLRACRERGIAVPEPGVALVDACDLCRRLFRDEASLGGVAELIPDLYRELSGSSTRPSDEGTVL
ncbi:radical SAM protein [Cellulosimicrobium cellulans]|uniref:radical SAM protein n=1 Tax=Cellulosimicrobium cellulans TaxID=1710 RepID=UPI00130E82FB|nr:radical SAM protein [Cellulosimicrobium cellulans]